MLVTLELKAVTRCFMTKRLFDIILYRRKEFGRRQELNKTILLNG